MKIEQEELDNIISLRNEFASLVSQYGSIALAKETLEEELKSIKKKYDEAKERETQFLTKLEEKYGVGNLDINSGEFTPTS